MCTLLAANNFYCHIEVAAFAGLQLSDAYAWTQTLTHICVLCVKLVSELVGKVFSKLALAAAC